MLTNVHKAIEELKEGKMVIIVDDQGRENEGDLAIAAEKVTPDVINFMATYAKGLVCMPMLGERLDELNIPPMVNDNTSQLKTAFTVSVDSMKRGVTTGISAFDRASTIKHLVDINSKPSDFGRPGHIFPLKYAPGGVLVRAGHTEAIVDLVSAAGMYPAGVICEIMADSGTMARTADLEKLAKKHDLKIVSVADIISYRRNNEIIIERLAEARIPTQYGEFKAVSYRSLVDSGEHVAFVKGNIDPNKPSLVRVHSECVTGDVFGSIRCDCGDQMRLALQQIANSDAGVLVYMRQEGRGIGLHNKLKAYALQDEELLDTVDANVELGFKVDLRHFGLGAQILADLGVVKFNLLTNNPKKVVGLESFGLKLEKVVPIIVDVNKENKKYLSAKSSRLGHKLDTLFN